MSASSESAGRSYQRSGTEQVTDWKTWTAELLHLEYLLKLASSLLNPRVSQRTAVIGSENLTLIESPVKQMTTISFDSDSDFGSSFLRHSCRFLSMNLEMTVTFYFFFAFN